MLNTAMPTLLKRPLTSTKFVWGAGLKAIYLAPSRALVQEKVRDWGERFGRTLGVTVREVTGVPH